MRKSAKNHRDIAAILRISAGVAALVIAVVAGLATVAWYRQGTSGSYVLPHGWGRISILVPPQATTCVAEMEIAYDGSQTLELGIRLSGLAHMKYGPAVGIIFDGSAVPPDSPWPYNPENTIHTSGELPSSPWAEYMFPVGTYLGTAWLIRLAKIDQSYQFQASYPGNEVGDGKPIDIDGQISNKNGDDLLVVSVRLAGDFRMEDGGRITYQPPLFEDFVGLQDLSSPTGLREISNSLPAKPLTVCAAGDIRKTLVYDSEAVDPSGRIDPTYQVDSAEPSIGQSDELSWQAGGRGQELAPVASLVSRPVAEDHERLMFLAAGGLAVVVAFVPIGLAQMPWPALERRRTRKRRKNLSIGPWCILTFQKSSDLRKQEVNAGPNILHQRRPWTTARKFLEEATESRLRIPILFSTESDGRVSYWGIIEEITIDQNTRETTCTYSSLHMIDPPRPLSEFRLQNGGQAVTRKPTGSSFIICYTPDFLI